MTIETTTSTKDVNVSIETATRIGINQGFVFMLTLKIEAARWTEANTDVCDPESPDDPQNAGDDSLTAYEEENGGNARFLAFLNSRIKQVEAINRTEAVEDEEASQDWDIYGDGWEAS
ncbi:Nn.00g005540.m01.CDS01 [Neocucurbitaria sp. VM-36]